MTSCLELFHVTTGPWKRTGFWSSDISPPLWSYFGCFATDPHLGGFFAAPHGSIITVYNGFTRNWCLLPVSGKNWLIANGYCVHLTTITKKVTWWPALWPSLFMTILARLNYYPELSAPEQLLSKKSERAWENLTWNHSYMAIPHALMAIPHALDCRNFIGNNCIPQQQMYCKRTCH